MELAGTALWLAAYGYDTTLVDVSRVALNVAEKEAAEKKVSLTTICHDLESGEPLGSLWDIAICCNFYDPDFFTQLHTCVVPGGIVFVRCHRHQFGTAQQTPAENILLNQENSKIS